MNITSRKKGRALWERSHEIAREAGEKAEAALCAERRYTERVTCAAERSLRNRAVVHNNDWLSVLEARVAMLEAKAAADKAEDAARAALAEAERFPKSCELKEARKAAKAHRAPSEAYRKVIKAGGSREDAHTAFEKARPAASTEGAQS